MKVAFLDRDGTIVLDYPDKQWSSITSPEFMRDAIEGIKLLRRKGYEIIIVTNQYIINEGHITMTQYNDFTQKLLNQLNEKNIKILDVFFCRHSDQEACSCKKPKTGMFEAAMEKYQGIDLDTSLMMGDSSCDQDFSKNCGLEFYGIKGGSIKNQKSCYSSIKEVAEGID